MYYAYRLIVKTLQISVHFFALISFFILTPVYAQEAETPFVLSHDASVRASWNSDSTMVLSISNGTAYVWDATTGAQMLELSDNGSIGGAIWNRDGSRVLTIGMNGSVQVWDVASGDVVISVSHEDIVWGASWNEDETRILTMSEDGSVRVWDATTGQELLNLPYEDQVWDAGWSSDEGLILVWTNTPFDCTQNCGGHIEIWNAVDGSAVARLAHDGLVWGHQLSTDGNRLLSWDDTTAYIWDVATGERILSVPHSGQFTGPQWNSDESRLITWSNSPTDCERNCEYVVNVWDSATADNLLQIEYTSQVRRANWSSDGNFIFSYSVANTLVLCDGGGDDFRLTVTDAESGDRIFNRGFGDTGGNASLNQDETMILATVNSCGAIENEATVYAYDVTSNSLIFPQFDYSAGWLLGADWSPDEHFISAEDFEGNVLILDAQSGGLLATLEHERDSVVPIWAPDSQPAYGH